MYDFEPIFEKVANRLSGRQVALAIRDTLSLSVMTGVCYKTGASTMMVEIKERGRDIDYQYETMLHETSHALWDFDRYAIQPKSRWLRPPGSDDQHWEQTPDEFTEYEASPSETLANKQTEYWQACTNFIDDRYGHLGRSECVYRKCLALLVLPLDELIHYTNTDSEGK